jgi:hypothetical protein
LWEYGNMEHKRVIALSTVSISALLFLYTLISSANKVYPWVGHDFNYFIPHLLDSYIHYKVNGLSIQWYTPSFGGGLPAYPNPQHVQFTLTALLMLFTGPWNAYWASSAIFILTGFISCYFLFEDVLEFDPLTSTIGSIIFNINGFVFSHAIVGHFGYQAFPLLPTALLVIFHKKIKPVYKGILLALIFGINIHNGGFYVIVIYLLSFLITIPILIILCPGVFSWKNFIQTGISTTLFTLMLCGSKLYAVASFMRWFPREITDYYNPSLFHGLLGILLQLFGSTTLLTVENLSGTMNITDYTSYTNTISDTYYGIWEFDLGISSAVLILCGLLPIFYIFTKRKKIGAKTILLLTLSLLGLWLTTEFRLTNGLIYPNIHHLPVIKSLHVNLRFTAAYLLPLSILSALGFKYLQETLKSNYHILGIFFFLVSLTIIPLFTYSSLPAIIYGYSFDISPANLIYQRATTNYEFGIKFIKHIPDLYVFNEHASNIRPHEPIFGYGNEYFHPFIDPGRVEIIKDNYFNMTNPASLVFPEENNLILFEKISANQQEELDQFIHYKQPNWKRPVIQNILDLLMLCSIFLVPIYILISLVQSRSK